MGMSDGAHVIDSFFTFPKGRYHGASCSARNVTVAHIIIGLCLLVMATVPMFRLGLPWWPWALMACGNFLTVSIVVKVSTRYEESFSALLGEAVGVKLDLANTQEQQQRYKEFRQVFPVSQDEVDRRLRAAASEVLGWQENRVALYVGWRTNIARNSDPQAAADAMRKEFHAGEASVLRDAQKALEEFGRLRDLARWSGHDAEDSWKSYINRDAVNEPDPVVGVPV